MNEWMNGWMNKRMTEFLFKSSGSEPVEVDFLC